MSRVKKIITFNNMIEANKLEQILIAEQIPHFIKKYEASGLAGVGTVEHGWGFLEAPEEYEFEIKTIFENLNHYEEEDSE